MVMHLVSGASQEIAVDTRNTPVGTIRKPYKVKEYADEKRLSLNGVYKMIARGEIPHERFGRSIRIPRRANGDK